ncbi:MAG TPA: hypothetical protein VE135_20365 [Pyrinomonadaceae bacterium]|nr:hypothetical protein [Pyrinomonadaceae bacterium]
MLPTIIAINLISLLSFQNLALSAVPAPEIPVNKFIEHIEGIKPPEEVQRLWDQAIAAKGGRERLDAVRNLIISSGAKYRTSAFKENHIRQEMLYALPNKFWTWNDLRPDVFGLRIEMYNYDTNVKYVITDGEPNHQPEPITDNKRKELFLNSLLPVLPESKWLKPVLVKASIGSRGLRPVDVVQTTVNGKRVDFALDPKTHLLVTVSYYDVVSDKTYVTSLALSNYVEISGIKVPQTIKYDDGTEYNQSYQFNVEYNQDLFIKPPSIEAGPEAWRVAKR